MSLADQIIALLSPLTGEMMAKSSLKLSCAKTGLTMESLDAEHLLPLSEQLYKGLLLFVGTEKAKEIADQIARMR